MGKESYNEEESLTYQMQGEEFYEKSLKAKTKREEKHYLSEAIKSYEHARVLAITPIQKERINNVLEKIKNRLRIMGIPLKNLESKTFPVFIFLSFILSLFFLSMNFTGNVVGTTKKDFSILGILFFIGGLIFSFVYATSKR
jgi:hypothetical protein